MNMNEPGAPDRVKFYQAIAQCYEGIARKYADHFAAQEAEITRLSVGKPVFAESDPSALHAHPEEYIAELKEQIRDERIRTEERLGKVFNDVITVKEARIQELEVSLEREKQQRREKGETNARLNEKMSAASKRVVDLEQTIEARAYERSLGHPPPKDGRCPICRNDALEEARKEGYRAATHCGSEMTAVAVSIAIEGLKS